MTWDKYLLENYKAFCSPEDVRLRDSHILKAYGIGTVRIKTRLEDRSFNCTLGETLLVPKLAVNLFSVRAADTKGNKIHFEDRVARIYLPSAIF